MVVLAANLAWKQLGRRGDPLDLRTTLIRQRRVLAHHRLWPLEILRPSGRTESDMPVSSCLALRLSASPLLLRRHGICRGGYALWQRIRGLPSRIPFGFEVKAPESMSQSSTLDIFREPGNVWGHSVHPFNSRLLLATVKCPAAVLCTHFLL